MPGANFSIKELNFLCLPELEVPKNDVCAINPDCEYTIKFNKAKYLCR